MCSRDVWEVSLSARAAAAAAAAAAVFLSVTETHRVCYRRIPEEIIIRAHNDPDWIAANSVQTGEETESEEDGDISVSDDSSSRLLRLLFASCVWILICCVRNEAYAFAQPGGRCGEQWQ